MKACAYCGRENDENAVQCVECGTEICPFESVPGPKCQSPLYRQDCILWLLALAVAVQAAVRVALTPSDPGPADGDYKRVEAAFYLWLCLAIAIVLFGYGYGYYLRSKATDEDVA